VTGRSDRVRHLPNRHRDDGHVRIVGHAAGPYRRGCRRGHRAVDHGGLSHSQSVELGHGDGGWRGSCEACRRGKGEVSSPSIARYRGAVSSQRVPGGVVHKLPGDLRTALVGNPATLELWKDITPLARNEFICWVEDAKQQSTRERRIRRTQEELEEGKRRPCCWPGCAHRDRTGR